MDGPVLPQTVAPVEQPRQRTALVDSRWFPLLIAAMVACGTLCAIAAPYEKSFLTHEASIDVLLSDVDRGRVHGVYDNGGSVVWRPDGALTWSSARLDELARSPGATGSLGDLRREAAKVNRDIELDVRGRPRWWGWLQLTGGIGALLAFLLLIAGPDPRRANRWAWFWLLSVGRSYGVGVLAFLFLGARRGRPPTDPGERADGLKGFVLALVWSIVLGLAGMSVHGALIGDRRGHASYTYDAPR
jgi:hypothetical protein